MSRREPWHSLAFVAFTIAALVAAGSPPSSARPVPSFMGLGDLPGGGSRSYAWAILADGLIIAGTGNSTAGNETFRWTASEGMVGLESLSGPAGVSWGYGMSADGGRIVGKSSSAQGAEAFLWPSDNGMVGLGDLLGGGFDSEARRFR